MNIREGQLFAAREKRVADAISLTTPDKVPVILPFESFAFKHTGISQAEGMNNPVKYLEANFMTHQTFQPDMAVCTPVFGSVLKILGYKLMRWAGHGLADEKSMQYVESENMKAEEYDAFLEDPADFIVRKFWPRAFSRLKVFGQLSPLNSVTDHFGAQFFFTPFGLPESMEALEALKTAGQESLKAIGHLFAHVQKLAAAGFPMAFMGATLVPFDYIGDFLRGRKGIMLDMYRNPDKLTAACEKALPLVIRQGVDSAKASHNPRVFIALHGGHEAFMSLEQFHRFYWPTLQALLTALTDENLNPVVLVEGRYTSRLELLKDVPRGKVCYWFESVDMAKAKSELRETACIMGDVPLSLLVTGSPVEVKTYCTRLLDLFADVGGFILSSGGAMDDTKAENINAMIESVNEYRKS
jgi:uroporphyrinogen-III decarboxylase